MKNPIEIFKRNRMPTLSSSVGFGDIEDAFERIFRNPWSLLDEVRPMVSREWFQPTVDVDETADAYLLSVDIPGVKKDDVTIDLNGNVLTVSGERKQEEESKTENFRQFERTYGKFMRSFTLPASVVAAKVEASMEDGVLRIALPKVEIEKGRTIQVQEGRPNSVTKKEAETGMSKSH